MNIARNLGTSSFPTTRSSRRRRWSCRATRCSSSAREAGGADVGADAHRHGDHQRRGRARRHRDHLREARSRKRAARPRLDQPPRAHGAEVLHQEIAPVHVSGHACSEEMRTLLSPCGLARDADPRRIPDAGAHACARAYRHSRLVDRHRRERLGRRADARRGSHRRPDRGGRHLRRRARRGRRRGCRASRSASVRGRCPDRRDDGRPGRRRRHRAARADRTRRRRGRGADRRPARRGGADRRRAGADRRHRDQARPEHIRDGIGQVVYERTGGGR